MDQLITVLAALMTFVTSAIDGGPGPHIRSWDGTALKVDWAGLAYQATCKSSTGSSGSVGQVTYLACELPAEWERDLGFTWGLRATATRADIRQREPQRHHMERGDFRYHFSEDHRLGNIP